MAATKNYNFNIVFLLHGAAAVYYLIVQFAVTIENSDDVIGLVTTDDCLPVGLHFVPIYGILYARTDTLIGNVMSDFWTLTSDCDLHQPGQSTASERATFTQNGRMLEKGRKYWSLRNVCWRMSTVADAR